MTRIERLAMSRAFISSRIGEARTRRTCCGSRQMYGASRIENCGTNWPNCAAPSSTIWIAPEDADSMMSRDEPSCPAGNVWMSTAPPVSSRTCFATRSIIATEGWLAGSTVAQRSVVAAPARAGNVPAATPASAAPIHLRRVQCVESFIERPPVSSIYYGPGCRTVQPDCGTPAESVLLSGIHGKDFHRGRLALEWDGAERLDDKMLAQRRAGDFVDQDGASSDLGMGFEPSREVDDVADAGVGRPFVGAGVSGDHLAGRDADANPDRRLPGRLALDAEQIDQFHHLQRGAHRAVAMVRERHGRAEDGHQSIAHHLRPDAAMAADRIEHQRIKRVQKLDRFLGWLRLRERRETPDIGKHHRAMNALAAQRESGILQVLRHLRRGEAAHQLGLLVAQAFLFEARAYACLEQHRIDRFGEIVLGAELDAPHYVGDAFQRRSDDHPQGAQPPIVDP